MRAAVLEARRAGVTVRRAAEVGGVSADSVQRWTTQARRVSAQAVEPEPVPVVEPAPELEPEAEAEPEAEPETKGVGHRRVPGLGPEWTVTVPDADRDDVTLWWHKTDRVGRASRERQVGGAMAWEARHEPQGSEIGGRLVEVDSRGRGYASRAKALRALAAEARRARREATMHRTEPVAGLPEGWQLAQTQADADDGCWQVLAPGGDLAGTLTRTTYGGRPEWQARTPAGRLHPGRVVHPEATSPYRGADAEAWRTRQPAARALAYSFDPEQIDGYGLDI